MRDRKLPFVYLVLAILRLGKASMKRELDKFFQALGQMQDITAGALTHARRKLLPKVFIALNNTLVKNFCNRSRVALILSNDPLILKT